MTKKDTLVQQLIEIFLLPINVK